MNITETEAPSIDGVYPAKQPARAVWAALWRLLSEAKAPMEVGALAAVVSALVPSYSPVSVRAMLDNAVRDGLLERTGGRPQAVKIRGGAR